MTRYKVTDKYGYPIVDDEDTELKAIQAAKQWIKEYPALTRFPIAVIKKSETLLQTIYEEEL